jgi:glutamate synthase domain-containing protein 3
MTGGHVIILGKTGRNFAAGMSGGIAYVWDLNGKFNLNCNLATVELEKITAGEEEQMVKEMIQLHHTFTGSAQAERALADWSSFMKKCVKVMPNRRRFDSLK